MLIINKTIFPAPLPRQGIGPEQGGPCRDVPGYGGTYIVSPQGRVYRVRLRLVRTANGPRRYVQKKELQPFLANGCPSVCLSAGGQRRNVSIRKLTRQVFGP